MTAEELVACRQVGDCIIALRRMPLAARARIESESNTLFLLLARARQVAGSDDDLNLAIRIIEERVAEIQAELVTARM